MNLNSATTEILASHDSQIERQSMRGREGGREGVKERERERYIYIYIYIYIYREREREREREERKSGVGGESVDLGGRCSNKKKKNNADKR